MIIKFSLYDTYSTALSEEIVKRENIKDTLENDDFSEDVFLSDEAIITVLNEKLDEIGDIKISDLEVENETVFVFCDYGKVNDDEVVIRKILDRHKSHYEDVNNEEYQIKLSDNATANDVINYVKSHLKANKVKVLDGKSHFYRYGLDFTFDIEDGRYIEFDANEWSENSCGEYYLRDENGEYNPISLEDFEEEEEDED